jgi:formate dehydrogenase subunit delta
MNVDHLVAMANQIGEFFKAMPDHAEALEGIATHIHKFWAPRMRTELATHIAHTGGAGLLPIVREALERHASVLA